MGSYRGLYENYYENLRGKNNRYKSFDYKERNSYGGKRKKRGGMLRVIYIQFIGALTLIVLMMALKYLPYDKGNKVYSNAKEVIAKEYNLEEFKVLDAFNEFKKKLIENKKDV